MHNQDRRRFLGTVGAVAGGLALFPEIADGQQKKNPATATTISSELSENRDVSVILGRAGDRSITANVLSRV